MPLAIRVTLASSCFLNRPCRSSNRYQEMLARYWTLHCIRPIRNPQILIIYTVQTGSLSSHPQSARLLSFRTVIVVVVRYLCNSTGHLCSTRLHRPHPLRPLPPPYRQPQRLLRFRSRSSPGPRGVLLKEGKYPAKTYSWSVLNFTSAFSKLGSRGRWVAHRHVNLGLSRFRT